MENLSKNFIIIFNQKNIRLSYHYYENAIINYLITKKCVGGSELQEFLNHWSVFLDSNRFYFDTLSVFWQKSVYGDVSTANVVVFGQNRRSMTHYARIFLNYFNTDWSNKIHRQSTNLIILFELSVRQSILTCVVKNSKIVQKNYKNSIAYILKDNVKHVKVPTGILHINDSDYIGQISDICTLMRKGSRLAPCYVSPGSIWFSPKQHP